MTTHDFDLVVLGSGPAGQRAAIQAAKIGKRVALVERMPSLGGVCILTGTIPSKTFREAVLAATGSEVFEFTPTDSTPPSMSEVLSRVQQVMMRETEVIKDQLLRNGVEIIQGSGRFTGKAQSHKWVRGGQWMKPINICCEYENSSLSVL